MPNKRTEAEKEKVFWSRVNKTDTCWFWTGATSKTGYGNYYNIGSHRYSYQVSNGKIQKGMVVMHTCDNKTCVNPDHLLAGTHKDNTVDMLTKGRNAIFPGEKHGNAKLKEKDVKYILSEYKRGNRWNPGNASDLAIQFNVTKQYIHQLGRGDGWNYLTQWLKEKQ